jgi:transposase-like protein
MKMSKDKIIELSEQGKSVTDIAKNLNVSKAHVSQTLKRYREKNPTPEPEAPPSSTPEPEAKIQVQDQGPAAEVIPEPEPPKPKIKKEHKEPAAIPTIPTIRLDKVLQKIEKLSPKEKAYQNIIRRVQIQHRKSYIDEVVALINQYFDELI